MRLSHFECHTLESTISTHFKLKSVLKWQADYLSGFPIFVYCLTSSAPSSPCHSLTKNQQHSSLCPEVYICQLPQIHIFHFWQARPTLIVLCNPMKWKYLTLFIFLFSYILFCLGSTLGYTEITPVHAQGIICDGRG